MCAPIASLEAVRPSDRLNRFEKPCQCRPVFLLTMEVKDEGRCCTCSRRSVIRFDHGSERQESDWQKADFDAFGRESRR